LLAPSALILVDAAAGVSELVLPASSRSAAAVALVVLAVSGAWWIVRYRGRYGPFLAVVTGRESFETAWSRFHGRNYSLAGEIATARWIREHSDARDTVFVWG